MADDSFETPSEAAADQQERSVFNIDGVSYAMDGLPEAVVVLINDLLRFSQEQNELQYRLRTLQAAQQNHVAAIKQELAIHGVMPLGSSDDQAMERA
jgi:hypothetical protein